MWRRHSASRWSRMRAGAQDGKAGGNLAGEENRPLILISQLPGSGAGLGERDHQGIESAGVVLEGVHQDGADVVSGEERVSGGRGGGSAENGAVVLENGFAEGAAVDENG